MAMVSHGGSACTSRQEVECLLAEEVERLRFLVADQRLSKYRDSPLSPTHHYGHANREGRQRPRDALQSHEALMLLEQRSVLAALALKQSQAHLVPQAMTAC